MVKRYSREPANAQKAAKASAKDLRVHFKNTFETSRVLKGLTVAKAKAYLNEVLKGRRCVPFRKHNGHVGRTGQAIQFGVTQGRWPQKSVKLFLGLIQNLEANANVKGLDAAKLVIRHVQVNRAQKSRRRTYRAHGRINPFLSNNCHIEIWAVEQAENVEKAENKGQIVRLSKRQAAQQRLHVGEKK